MKSILNKLMKVKAWRYAETKFSSFPSIESPATMTEQVRIVEVSDRTEENDHANNYKELQTGCKDQVGIACCSLKKGLLVAVPTDTIYGVAGLAQNTAAIQRIYAIKDRDLAKPIAICVGDVADVKKWGKLTISQALLTELLPGPVTIVLERTAALNPNLNPGTSLVGIRVPDCGFVREVVRASAEPLALTSANISGGPSTVNIQEFCELWSHLDVVFDGGTLGTSAHSRLGSTVVDLSKAGTFTIIRPGSAFKNTVHSLKKFGLQEETKS